MKRDKQPRLKICWDRRPRVLFVGNGMSRAFGGSSWSDIIREINYTGTDLREIGKAPFPLQAVIATGDRVNLGAAEIGEKLKKPMNRAMGEYMRELIALPFDAVLTTNYSYELEEAADPRFLEGKGRFRRYAAHTAACRRAESRFRLYTYYHIPRPGGTGTVNIWHLHGEADKPGTMIFGHYYYGNLLYRYQDYFKRRGNLYEIHQQRRQDLEVRSWLDYFILADIYVLGCGLDFSEMDLWWLINRKKREPAQTGRLYHLEPYNQANHIKQSLMQAFGCEQLPCGFEIDRRTPQGEALAARYREFYRQALAYLQEIFL